MPHGLLNDFVTEENAMNHLSLDPRAWFAVAVMLSALGVSGSAWSALTITSAS